MNNQPTHHKPCLVQPVFGFLGTSRKLFSRQKWARKTTTWDADMCQVPFLGKGLHLAISVYIPEQFNCHQRESQRYNLPFTWMLPEFWSKIYQEKAAISQQNRLFVAEMGENLEMGETTKCHEISKNLSASLRQHIGDSIRGGHPLTWVTNCRVRIKLTPRQCQA